MLSRLGACPEQPCCIKCKHKCGHNVGLSWLGQTASLGTYEDEADAARAYDRAHYEMYGRLDLLNFPVEIEREVVPSAGEGNECWFP